MTPVPPGAPGPAGGGAKEAGDSSASKALDLVTRIVAPTTLLTALAFYFGWAFTNARFSYFGIDAATAGFTTQEYLLRSTDALFIPLGTALLVILGGLLLFRRALRALADRDGSHQELVERLALAALVIGGLLLLVGIIAIWVDVSWVAPHVVAAGPGVGIGLMASAAYIRARAKAPGDGGGPQPAATGQRGYLGLVVGLIVLSAFWSASEYARALGLGRAQDFAEALHKRPHVTVFTPKRLSIRGDGVTEQQLSGDGLAYRYRYSGLRLLVRGDAKYVLLPDAWTRTHGKTIVLADSPGRRFEFAAGDCEVKSAANPHICADDHAAANRAVLSEVATSVETFGRVRVGRVRTRRFVVPAEGKGGAGITRVSLTGRHVRDFAIRDARCSRDLDISADARCELTVRFAPRARGERRANAVIAFEDDRLVQRLIGIGARRSR